MAQSHTTNATPVHRAATGATPVQKMPNLRTLYGRGVHHAPPVDKTDTFGTGALWFNPAGWFYEEPFARAAVGPFVAEAFARHSLESLAAEIQGGRN